MRKKQPTPIPENQQVTLEDLSRAGLKRIVLNAWRQQADDQLPYHRRNRLAVEDALDSEVEEEEYEKLADLHEEQFGASSPPKLLPADLPNGEKTMPIIGID